MGNKINKINVLNRIKKAYDLSGNSDLARHLGVAPNTITNWYNRNSIDFDIVFTKCVDLNLEWLITGTGEIRKSKGSKSAETITISESDAPYGVSNLSETFKPHIDSIYANCGIPNGFSVVIIENECEAISIPFVGNYDFSIRASGDSMINIEYPKRSIRDQDIIACKLWTSQSHIRWGEVYALATESGIIIKKIMPSDQEGFIKCESFNVQDGFKTYELPLEEIFDWAIVVGVVNITTW